MTEEFKTESYPMEALVKNAADGDRAAMEELYKRTNAELWRTVRALAGSEADAMDLMQETYLKAFSELKTLRNKESFLPWLKKIAVNEHRQELRRNQPLLFSELAVEDADALTSEPLRPLTPERVYERKEQAEAVQQALSTLPDGQRTVLVLHYCEQYSVEEIAEQLGITKNTVKVQLHRGRKALAAALRRGGLLLAGLMLSRYLLRWQSAQAAPSSPAGKSVPAEQPRHRPLPVKTAGRVLLDRAAIVAVSAVAVAGLAVGGFALSRALRTEQPPMPEPPIQIRAQETEPSVPRETKPIRDPGRTAVTTEEFGINDPTTVPKEQPTELPVTPPEEAQPKPTEPNREEPKPSEPEKTEPAAIPSATPADAPPVVATPPDAPEPTAESTPEQTAGRLPTENPYPFSFREETTTVGQSWSMEFESDRTWAVVLTSVDSEAPDAAYSTWNRSSFSDGRQSVSVGANEPGTYTWSFQNANGVPIPFLTLHVVLKED